MKRFFRPVGLAVGLLLCSGRLIFAADGASWQAGVSREKITPPNSVWMAGYAARTKPADGTLQDLWAKAMVLQDAQGRKVVLVTLDLCGFDREVSDTVRSRIEQKIGISRDAVALCASHTHSGPIVGHHLRPTYGLSDVESEKIRHYTAWMEDQAVRAAEHAAAKLLPVRVSYSADEAGFATNRRENKEADVQKSARGDASGSAEWRRSLKGPGDPTVPVLAVTTAEGTELAVVFAYACHATTLSGYEWCGDWPGYACEAIEADRPGSTAFFIAGCGADQNPIPRREVALAKNYGRQAADAVNRALKKPGTPADGPLLTNYREVDLPFGDLPSREQLQQQLASKDPKDRALARRAGMLLERYARDGGLPKAYPYPVQTWSFGPSTPVLALLGGEAVVDYALRLKKELGGPTRLWPAAYSNDVMAYVPSRRVLAEGGYEGGDSMVYYAQPARWGEQVEETIVKEVHRQVDALKGAN